MWPLKRGWIYMKFTMTRKKWPFNTGDCLIEVTSWAGLTVSENLPNENSTFLEKVVIRQTMKSKLWNFYLLFSHK